MAVLQRKLDNEDIRVTDNGDIRILSESNIYDDIIEYRLSLKQVVSLNTSIKQVVDFTKGL